MTTDSAKPTLVCLRVPEGDPPLYFFDDHYGACSLCGHRIRFRPHCASIETKICVECVEKATAGAPVVQASITPETAEELAAYRKGTRQ